MARRVKPPVNNRPEGWGMEGRQVNNRNRHLFPSSRFEVVTGRSGTKWARPRTELTGIDEGLRGMVRGYDDATARGSGQIDRVYGALGAELQRSAADSATRLGGLGELAGRSVPGLFRSAPVAAPGGGTVAATADPADAAAADRAATLQRMLVRDAALNVNTANLDAQQAPQAGARERARYEGERSAGRDALLKALVLQSRQDAMTLRGQDMELEAEQMDDATRREIEAAKLEQRRAEESGRNSRAGGSGGGGGGAGGADAKAKAKADALQRTRMNEWIKRMSGYEGSDPLRDGIVNGKWEADPADPTKEVRVGGESVGAFFGKLVGGAGINPMNAVRVLIAGGVPLSANDAYTLLLPKLGARRALATVKQLGLGRPTAANGPVRPPVR